MKRLLFLLVLPLFANAYSFNPYYVGSTTYDAVDVYQNDNTDVQRLDSSTCSNYFYDFWLDSYWQSHTDVKGANFGISTWDNGGTLYCSYQIKDTLVNQCTAPDIFNPDTQQCEYIPDCNVTNSHYDLSSEGCVCDVNYLPTYDLNGLKSCDLPECPTVYEQHQPPLPLFSEVSNPANCNFFPFGDNAVATLIENVKYCCYGQQNEDNNSTCGPNEIQIGDNCYPIQDNDDNSTDPIDCGAGSSWSDSANQCLPDDIYSNDLNGTMSNNIDNNGTQGSLPNQGDIDAFLDIANFDGLKDEMGSLLNRYVLIQLPVNVGGTCTNEFTQTFSFMGHSYTINLNSYMSAVYDYLPLLKGIILFMMALSGVVIVLSSGRD